MYFIIRKALIKMTKCFVKTNDRKMWNSCVDHLLVILRFFVIVYSIYHVHPFSSTIQNCTYFTYSKLPGKYGKITILNVFERYAHQGCIYLIKNTVKQYYCEILLQSKITVF